MLSESPAITPRPCCHERETSCSGCSRLERRRASLPDAVPGQAPISLARTRVGTRRRLRRRRCGTPAARACRPRRRRRREAVRNVARRAGAHVLRRRCARAPVRQCELRCRALEGLAASHGLPGACSVRVPPRAETARDCADRRAEPAQPGVLPAHDGRPWTPALHASCFRELVTAVFPTARFGAFEAHFVPGLTRGLPVQHALEETLERIRPFRPLLSYYFAVAQR